MPKRFAHLDPRSQVRECLFTDSEAEAQRKAPGIEARFLAHWEALAAGEAGDAAAQYAAARRRAEARGLAYLPADQGAERAALREALARLEAVVGASGQFLPATEVAAELRGLDLACPFEKLAFRTAERRVQFPFSPGWIRDRLLAPGALGGMGEEARATLLMMVNTGARPSEISGAAAEDFTVEAEIPHFVVRAQPWRTLRTAHSAREIPLLGVSLAAARDLAEAGFALENFTVQRAVRGLPRTDGARPLSLLARPGRFLGPDPVGAFARLDPRLLAFGVALAGRRNERRVQDLACHRQVARLSRHRLKQIESPDGRPRQHGFRRCTPCCEPCACFFAS